MGCDEEAQEDDFTCLVVRCADDFTISVHPYSSRQKTTGIWQITIDREARQMLPLADETPYGAHFSEDGDWLLDRLRHGTFVYLRHETDADRGFAHIDLKGSLQSIAQALYWCAPRTTPIEQNSLLSVEPEETMEKANEPSAIGAQ